MQWINDYLDSSFLVNYGAYIAISILVFAVLIYVMKLLREQARLQQEFVAICTALRELREGQQDIGSQCVVLQQQFLAHEKHVAELQDLLIDIRQQSITTETPPEQSRYHQAIQFLKQGIAVEKIMTQCHLTRDEVDMLAALHLHEIK